jgi:two-component system copper resistance phosphate regulon response regulator CusR
MMQRLLLVEDDQRLARSYQRNLEAAGYLVETVHDGDVAYDIVSARPERFHALILDILLPGRDGVALCRDLRAAGIEVPIVLLTALDQTEDMVAGLDAGADDYVTKPFPFAELLARLRALSRRPTGFAPRAAITRLEIADLIIDVQRHEASRAGEPIHLTLTEFTLLELLARNAGMVVTRDRLTEHIWPEGTEAGSNVLESYIHFLREKIDRGHAHKLIQTVRGVGYSLRAPAASAQGRARESYPASIGEAEGEHR